MLLVLLVFALLVLPAMRGASAHDSPAKAAASIEASTSAPTSLSASVPAFVAWRAVGDAIPEPLGGFAGDAARGERLVSNRRESLCLLCHQGPFAQPRMQGTVAPPLQGAGARWSEAQLRLRIVDARLLNAESIMPTYHRRDDRERVGKAWEELPILDAQQIEDVVAWLVTLK